MPTGPGSQDAEFPKMTSLGNVCCFCEHKHAILGIDWNVELVRLDGPTLRPVWLTCFLVSCKVKGRGDSGVFMQVAANTLNITGDQTIQLKATNKIELLRSVRIDSSGVSGTPSVTLDIQGTDAVQLTSGTTAERPTAAAGMIRFNTTTSKFEGYDGTSWIDLN